MLFVIGCFVPERDDDGDAAKGQAGGRGEGNFRGVSLDYGRRRFVGNGLQIAPDHIDEVPERIPQTRNVPLDRFTEPLPGHLPGFVGARLGSRNRRDDPQANANKRGFA